MRVFIVSVLWIGLLFAWAWCDAQTWTFDAPEDLVGWRADAKLWSGGGNVTDLRIEEGILKVKLRAYWSWWENKWQVSYNARLLSPPLDAPTEWFDRLIVRMRLSHGFIYPGKYFTNKISTEWLTTAMPALGPYWETPEGTVVGEPCEGLTDEWRTFVLSLDDLLWWDGKVLRFILRFYPSGGFSTGEPPEWWIDEIRLTGPVFEAMQEGEAEDIVVRSSGDVYDDLQVVPVPWSGVLWEEATGGEEITANNLGAIFGGDVDGDGDVDLVVNSEVTRYKSSGLWIVVESEQFAVLHNEGEGAFSVSEQEKDKHCNLVYGGDLDGDGRMDLILTNRIWESPEEWNLSVLLNRGEHFEPGWSYPGFINKAHGDEIYGGDLDGDGDVDLAWRERLDLVVFRNRGDGTFEEMGRYGFDDFLATRMRGCDVDGDGDTDLVVGDSEGWYDWTSPFGLYVLVNDGTGSFDVEEFTRLDRSVVAWDAGDMDGDGDLDGVVIARQKESTIEGDVLLLRNAGDGNFAQEVLSSIWRVSRSIGGLDPRDDVRVADVDLDGDLDVVVVSAWDVAVWGWLNRGDGTFEDGGRYDLSGDPWGMFLGDLDGDGDLDVAVSDLSGNAVSVLFNRTRVGVTAIVERRRETEVVPQRCILYGNVPNPFNAMTLIPFDLSFSGRVRLGVYDVLGRKVRTLLDGEREMGTWTVRWDGRDDAGHPVASGRYLVRLQVGTFSDSEIMTLVK